MRLQFKTDAENQYFTREIEPGFVKVDCNGLEELSWDDNLWNGKHNITIDLPKTTTEVGQQLVIQVTVGDESRPEPFVHDVYLNVVPKKHHPPSSPSPNPGPPGPRPGPDVPDRGEAGIPNVHSVEKDQWGEHGFDKFSGLKVVHNGAGYDYFYNRDNAYLLQEQKISQDTEAELLESQFSTALVIIGMGIMSNEAKIEEEKCAAQVESITKLLSPVLLPMINGLGSIKLSEI